MFLAEASIQLVPDGTLLLHLLMVAVMVFILNRTLLKPINQIQPGTKSSDVSLVIKARGTIGDLI